MSKAILMSIKPKYVAKILNGEKTIEIRKRFPKDYVGWIYIYCTKNGDRPIYLPWEFDCHIEDGKFVADCDFEKGNGKVVARFWCDKVEDYVNGCKWSWKKGAPMWGVDAGHEMILKPSCLTEDELYDYCEDLAFNAIYITKLEIFDKPKEISEFENYNMVREVELNAGYYKGFDTSKITVVKKAPQSRFYVEVKE